MKGQVKNAVSAFKKEEAAKDAPRILERTTERQRAAIKIHRRAGLKEQEIADLMGISLASVSRHSRGVKPNPPDGEEPRERPAFSKNVSPPNGGETLVLAEPKPKKFAVEVELDPQLVLLLAGDSARLGYGSVTQYIKEYNIPWLAAITEGADLINAKTPVEYKQKLLDIAKDALAFRKMLKESQKEAEKTVVQRDGQQGSGS